MSSELIGGFGILAMIILMFLGMPVAIALGLTGLIGVGLVTNWDKAFNILSLVPYTTVANYTLSVLPVFLLLGEFADVSGMMLNAYDAARKWLGNLPGGLAMASVSGAALFASVSGSSMACAALMSRVSLPQLLEFKYDKKLAAGCLCAGGTLGPLIPPGMPFVIYALLSDTSVGKLYIASLIPGIMLAVMYLVQIYIQCRINPKLGPPGPKIPLKEKVFAIKQIWALVTLFVIVMGGIWFGIFTATEAGSIGAVGAFLFALGSRKLSGRVMQRVLKNTLRTVGMIFATVTGVWIFTAFVTLSGLSTALADWVISMNLTGFGVVCLIMVVYLILGTALETMPMILLTLPIFLGILVPLNVDLIWFGVLIVIQMELGAISPPTGIILFVVYAMNKDKGISMGTIYRGVLPFAVTMIIFNIFILFFPQIATFMVSRM